MEPLNDSQVSPDVRRQARNPKVWEVRLPGETEHQIVLLELQPAGDAVLYCSCQEVESPGADALEPAAAHCAHRQAVAVKIQQQRDLAAARRARGLCYVGRRVATRPCLTGSGWLTVAQVCVWEDDAAQLLDPRPSQQLRNHSPDGFEWGYAGSGPAQLALAILLDYTGDEALALSRYQEFKSAIIAALPQEAAHWEIDAEQIAQFLAGDPDLSA